MSSKKIKKSKRKESNYIKYLVKFHENDNRGVLAHLRRGLQYNPGDCMEMYPYVIPWIQNTQGKWNHDIHFMIASLFAFYPHIDGKGNFGDAFRAIQSEEPNNSSIESRFIGLIRSHKDDIFTHLRQAISLLKSRNVKFDWHQLYYDLKYWNTSKYPPYKRWANSFWKYRKSEEATQDN
ncbi:MAG: type I-E CRISPR-associated protein Cse2/CasB [Candidatus Lokiarchaeota archaeon]|nr:type I-E CRISPR-associated protein Cse2/CasB [Candidatus Lokiarchaeota archaeon]